MKKAKPQAHACGFTLQAPNRHEATTVQRVGIKIF